MGDFNAIQFHSEKVGGMRRSWGSMTDFREAMEDNGLKDIGFSGPIFTWSNKREGELMIMERLDRGLCNNYWRSLFPNSKIHHLQFWGSDHHPLILKSDLNPSMTVNCNKNWKRRFYLRSVGFL